MPPMIREVKFKDNREAVVAEWYYARHADELTTRKYADLLSYARDQVNDNLSDGEFLDIVIDLYDHGISYFS